MRQENRLKTSSYSLSALIAFVLALVMLIWLSLALVVLSIPLVMGTEITNSIPLLSGMNLAVQWTYMFVAEITVIGLIWDENDCHVHEQVLATFVEVLP